MSLMSGSNVTHPVADDFPSAGFPIVFADGVLNASISPTVVKFYLYRFEPSFKGNNQYQTQPVAQVVMPVDGLVGTAAFFDAQVQTLIRNKVITQERYDEYRRGFAPSS
jgi:hypothetical protein